MEFFLTIKACLIQRTGHALYHTPYALSQKRQYGDKAHALFGTVVTQFKSPVSPKMSPQKATKKGVASIVARVGHRPRLCWGRSCKLKPEWYTNIQGNPPPPCSRDISNTCASHDNIYRWSYRHFIPPRSPWHRVSDTAYCFVYQTRLLGAFEPGGPDRVPRYHVGVAPFGDITQCPDIAPFLL